jgi:hypothetical protein
MLRLANVVFWIALSLWLSLAMVGGIAAMAIFPAARELPLSMEGYEGFIAVEPVMGRQLVAGHLVERVFALADMPRLICAIVCGLALLTHLALTRKPPLARTRLVALAVGSGALLVGTFYALPAFQAKDRAYREAAAIQGDAATQKARVRHKEVTVAHEIASNVASAEVGAVLALIVLSSIASVGAGRRE